MAEELLSLYKKEQLHAALGTGHMFAAQRYNAVGNAKMAAWHAKKAVDLGIVGSEDNEGDMEQMREMVREPRKHWTFRAQRKS